MDKSNKSATKIFWNNTWFTAPLKPSLMLCYYMLYYMLYCCNEAMIHEYHSTLIFYSLQWENVLLACVPGYFFYNIIIIAVVMLICWTIGVSTIGFIAITFPKWFWSCLFVSVLYYSLSRTECNNIVQRLYRQWVCWVRVRGLQGLAGLPFWEISS